MLRCGVLVSAILFWTVSVFAQQFPFTLVTRPGDPTQLEAIVQDSQGRLWVGGRSGAAIFDGTRFFKILDFTSTYSSSGP
jgi:hypothetical protein